MYWYLITSSKDPEFEVGAVLGTDEDLDDGKLRLSLIDGVLQKPYETVFIGEAPAEVDAVKKLIEDYERD